MICHPDLKPDLLMYGDHWHGPDGARIDPAQVETKVVRYSGLGLLLASSSHLAQRSVAFKTPGRGF